MTILSPAEYFVICLGLLIYTGVRLWTEDHTTATAPDCDTDLAGTERSCGTCEECLWFDELPETQHEERETSCFVIQHDKGENPDEMERVYHAFYKDAGDCPAFERA